MPAAGWKREFELRPQRAAITYEKFKYPVADVCGSVRRTIGHAGGDNTLIEGNIIGLDATQFVDLANFLATL